jgi:hypothetical protein
LTLRARPLASLGAVVTILALAFDPFIQQVLQYPSIPSIDPDQESSVVRTSKFAINATSADWLKAVDKGIRSNPEQYAQKPVCPSGNCTWGEYPTTGWCSKCQDATSYVKIIDCNGYSLGRDLPDRCLIDFGHGKKIQVAGPWETYDKLYERFTIFKAVVWPLSLLNTNFSLPLDNETYAGVTNPIVALGNIHLKPCSNGDLDEGLCITYAEECALSLCTRQSQTSVVNGTTNIDTLEEDFGCLSQIHQDSDEVTMGVNTHCWQAGKLCEDLDFVNLTSSNSPGFGNAGQESLDYCSDGIVVQTNTYSDTVQSKLLTRLTGNQTSLWYRSDSSHFDESQSDTTTSSFTMDYITANGLEPVLAGVAASLTQQALLANTSEKVTGTVWTTETYVAVDWPWLIYPATLVLGAIIFLALTATHSHRCGLKIWKSSMLPLLYRTLDPELLSRQPVLHDVSTMTGVAGKAKVTLVETSREDGVVLTQ